MGHPLDPKTAKPMLAKAVHGLDELSPDDYLFEPKWDGFRCMVFRDGDELTLSSRNQKPMGRYFPELLAPLRDQLPTRCIVDGELVVAGPHGLDFDALQQRIHPADSRIDRLAAETPASFVAFDLLWLGDRDLRVQPFADRRRQLEEALARVQPPVHLTPATHDIELAADWFERFEGAGLDGVMAKPTQETYEHDKRSQYKVKHRRTADCVVGGYRLHKSGDGVGSLLLGLHDTDGRLHHVGVATSFTARRRAELVEEVRPLEVPEDDLADHPWGAWAEASAHDGSARLPGGVSRWNAKKDLSFVALRPERVAEVGYENLQSGRFRHSARLIRWRPDRDPDSCTFEQLEQVAPFELQQIFGAG